MTTEVRLQGSRREGRPSRPGRPSSLRPSRIRIRTQVVLNVEMACSGCSGAVERVLKKMAGESALRRVPPLPRPPPRRSAVHAPPAAPALAGSATCMIHVCGDTPAAALSATAAASCAPAPQRRRAAGVQTFDVSLEKQRVVVRGDVTPEAVLETVRKTGKKAELAK